MKYAIIGVEGPHDQAFTGKVLKLLSFKDFREEWNKLDKLTRLDMSKELESKFDKFWHKFIPRYPKQGDLYKRLDMPSILFNDTVSVVIYAGEGSNLVINLDDILSNNSRFTFYLRANVQKLRLDRTLHFMSIDTSGRSHAELSHTICFNLYLSKI